MDKLQIVTKLFPFINAAENTDARAIVFGYRAIVIYLLSHLNTNYYLQLYLSISHKNVVT